MILGDIVGTAAESPGSYAAGQKVTYGIEDRRPRWTQDGAEETEQSAH
jgi:hypothetical protein